GEGGMEAVAGNAGPLLAEQAAHPLFPGKPVGVQGSAEVEQHGSAVVRGQKQRRRELVEAVGIEPTSGNPQPQASTSIVDLRYCFSPRGTPLDRITARPASQVSPP